MITCPKCGEHPDKHTGQWQDCPLSTSPAPSLSKSHNSDRQSQNRANPLDLKPIAALCVSGRSIYKYLPGVEVFDKRRDARQFAGNMPVVAHPPCRLWSKYLSHQAKSPAPEEEKELGRWCVRTVLKCGGVLEQPAHSKLWKEMNLPMPSEPAREGILTIYIEQSWFGYASRKPTWLLVCGVPIRELPAIPFSLVKARHANSPGLSSFARSRTVKPFAEWLCQIARRANAIAA